MNKNIYQNIKIIYLLIIGLFLNPIFATTVTGTGSGFYINNSYIITNHHVIGKCESLEVIQDNVKKSVTLYRDDKRNDIAILKSSTQSSAYLKFSNNNIAQGEDIVVLGFPLGNILGSSVKVTKGNVSSLNGLRDDTTRFQLTAPIQSGNSGGPILNMEGEVIGISVSSLEFKGSQNINFGIKGNTITSFLNSSNITPEYSASSVSLSTKAIVRQATPAIVKVICKNTIVNRYPSLPPQVTANKYDYMVVGVKSNDVLNVRSGPSTKYPIAFVLPPDSKKVRLLNCQTNQSRNAWCKIESSGREGWVNSRFIALKNRPHYTPERMYEVVNVRSNDTLNVRSGAGSKFQILAKLPYDEKNIKVLKENVNKNGTRWYYIKSRFGKGWVYERYIREMR